MSCDLCGVSRTGIFVLFCSDSSKEGGEGDLALLYGTLETAHFFLLKVDSSGPTSRYALKYLSKYGFFTVLLSVSSIPLSVPTSCDTCMTRFECLRGVRGLSALRKISFHIVPAKLNSKR